MTTYTIKQAATRIHRSPETIRRWLREERLTCHTNEANGRRYVNEGELLQVEQLLRGRQRQTRIPAAIAS